MNDKVFQKARRLLDRCPLPLSPAELERFKTDDFGLGQLEVEGFAFIDLLRTDLVRTTVIVLLPHQTLPEHKHPPYDGSPGKEETVRCLWGTFKVYVEGEAESKDLLIPPGKDAYYTARKEHSLSPGDQFTVPIDIRHWFQAGPEGAIAFIAQNRVNEDHNIFYDPESTGCKIPNVNT